MPHSPALYPPAQQEQAPIKSEEELKQLLVRCIEDYDFSCKHHEKIRDNKVNSIIKNNLWPMVQNNVLNAKYTFAAQTQILSALTRLWQHQICCPESALYTEENIEHIMIHPKPMEFTENIGRQAMHSFSGKF